MSARLAAVKYDLKQPPFLKKNVSPLRYILYYIDNLPVKKNRLLEIAEVTENRRFLSQGYGGAEEFFGKSMFGVAVGSRKCAPVVTCDIS
jgi:hypothetical protein